MLFQHKLYLIYGQMAELGHLFEPQHRLSVVLRRHPNDPVPEVVEGLPYGVHPHLICFREDHETK